MKTSEEMTWHRHQEDRFQEIRKNVGLRLQNKALKGCASTQGTGMELVLHNRNPQRMGAAPDLSASQKMYRGRQPKAATAPSVFCFSITVCVGWLPHGPRDMLSSSHSLHIPGRRKSAHPPFRDTFQGMHVTLALAS